MSAEKLIEKEIREAYIFLRKNNTTISSETLQFVLDASLEKLHKNAKQSKQEEVNDNPHLGYKTALVPDEISNYKHQENEGLSMEEYENQLADKFIEPQPHEKVDVEKILHQVYDAGVRNVDCDLTTHYEQIKNTLQDTKIREAAEEWNKYKSFLQEKYPVEEGEEWQFTCEQHQKIDEILNSKKH